MKQNTLLSCRSLLVLAPLALAGCGVYAPLQPTVSGIRHAGEIEASASIQGSGRLEAGLVAAPVPHLLLAGAGSYRPRLGTGAYFETRQWEAAAGSYLALGPRYTLSALGGYGYGRTGRIYAELWGYSPELRAAYTKGFGQANLHLATPHIEAGVVYRLTQLHFTELSYRGFSYPGVYDEGNLNITTQRRHEVLLYAAVNLRRVATQWQLQARSTVGLSLAESQRGSPGQPDTPEYNRARVPALVASVGLVFARRPAAVPVVIPR